MVDPIPSIVLRAFYPRCYHGLNLDSHFHRLKERRLVPKVLTRTLWLCRSASHGDPRKYAEVI